MTFKTLCSIKSKKMPNEYQYQQKQKTAVYLQVITRDVYLRLI